MNFIPQVVTFTRLDISHGFSHGFSRARRSAASAWRNLLHLVWLPWARDLLHWSHMTFKSSGRMGAPRSLTVRRSAVMLPPPDARLLAKDHSPGQVQPSAVG